MSAAEEWVNGPAAGTLLHNSGGPRSRTRTEEVRSSLLNTNAMNRSMEIIGIQIPEEVDDPEQWLQQLLGVNGYADWEQAAKSILIPTTKMLVLPEPGEITEDVNSPAFLRAVLILARCNKYRYLPDGPLIFTRSRLHRTIRLIDINTAYYYGME